MKDRFMSKVIPEPTTGCWLWTACTDGDGYGVFRVGSRTNGTYRTVRAHRHAYEATHGLVPQGAQLDHVCRTPACVNPEHLRVASPAENQHYSKPKGGTSRFKGVCWYAQTGKWSAQIANRGKRRHIGYFETEEDAAAAYDETALLLHGTFALTNRMLGLL